MHQYTWWAKISSVVACTAFARNFWCIPILYSIHYNTSWWDLACTETWISMCCHEFSTRCKSTSIVGITIRDRPICFFGADTDMSANYGPITDTNISKIFKSCFLLHYQKYNVFYALSFYWITSKIKICELKFFNILLWFLINLINDERQCSCFSCNGRRMLHGSPCLLVYENTPASIAAR